MCVATNNMLTLTLIHVICNTVRHSHTRAYTTSTSPHALLKSASCTLYTNIASFVVTQSVISMYEFHIKYASKIVQLVHHVGNDL